MGHRLPALACLDGLPLGGLELYGVVVCCLEPRGLDQVGVVRGCLLYGVALNGVALSGVALRPLEWFLARIPHLHALYPPRRTP